MKVVIFLALCLGVASAMSLGEHGEEEMRELLQILKSVNSKRDEKREIIIGLASGKTDGSGRIVIKHNGDWYSPCGEDFDLQGANVVCNQLGYLGAKRFGTTDEFELSAGPITGGFTCAGLEETLEDCIKIFSGNLFCETGSAVECQTKPVRLVGETEKAGRLEIYYDQEWYSPCVDDLDLASAQVMCRELGFTGVNKYGGTKEFEVEPGQIIAGYVCDGTETKLKDCGEVYNWNLGCAEGSYVECLE